MATTKARPKAKPEASKAVAAPVTPAGTHAVALPVHLQRAYMLTMDGLMRNSSLAYRLDRNLQRMMRNDPDIEGPLAALSDSVCPVDYSILPPAKASEAEKEIADDVQRRYRRIPQVSDFHKAIGIEGYWLGTGGSTLDVRPDGADGFDICGWLPIHGDTFVWDKDGNVGLRVGGRFIIDHPGRKTSIGIESRVVMLDQRELDATVIHTMNRRGPDFYETFETAYAYGGKGIRDVVWFYWALKQEILQNWATYCERYAMGIRKAFYPSGADASREMMLQLLQNLQGDVSALLPRSDPSQNDHDIEVMDPPAARAQVFADLVSWCADNIKEVIVGQKATSESVSTGLGSNVGKAQEKTFARRRWYFATSLAETLTSTVVRRLVDWNHGKQEPDRYPRLVFAVEHPDAESVLNATETFVNLGGEVPVDDVRNILGFRRPEKGEDVLSLEKMIPGAGIGGGLSSKPKNGKQTGRGAADGGDDRDRSDFSRVRGAWR